MAGLSMAAERHRFGTAPWGMVKISMPQRWQCPLGQMIPGLRQHLRTAGGGGVVLPGSGRDVKHRLAYE
jgi:hypothetical protein